jgi:steroid delta-isomerase-like uncharacterized protein
MSADNKAAYRRFMDELFNRGNLDIIDELVAPDVVTHAALPGQRPGAAGFKDAMAMFRSAFPDLRASVEDLVAEGDRVAGRFKVVGTHKGDFMGLPATGNPIAYEEMAIVRFGGGRIVEHWSVADAVSLLQAVGALPK